MTYWLRARRAIPCTLVALTVIVTVTVVGPLAASLPTLGGGGGLLVPVALLAPLLGVVALAWALSNGDLLLEALAVRPLAIYDVGFVASLALCTAGPCVVVGLLGWNPFGIGAARNMIGLAGLMLLGRRGGGGPMSALAPAAYVLGVATFGGDSQDDLRWWAWLAEQTGSVRSWVLPLMLAIVGGAVSLGRQRPLLLPDHL